MLMVVEEPRFVCIIQRARGLRSTSVVAVTVRNQLYFCNNKAWGVITLDEKRLERQSCHSRL